MKVEVVFDGGDAPRILLKAECSSERALLEVVRDSYAMWSSRTLHEPGMFAYSPNEFKGIELVPEYRPDKETTEETDE